MKFYEEPKIKTAKPGDHVSYWLDKFPLLFLHCYYVFSYFSENPEFNGFYAVDDSMFVIAGYLKKTDSLNKKGYYRFLHIIIMGHKVNIIYLIN
jgi:hypothetical protein